MIEKGVTLFVRAVRPTDRLADLIVIRGAALAEESLNAFQDFFVAQLADGDEVVVHKDVDDLVELGFGAAAIAEGSDVPCGEFQFGAFDAFGRVQGGQGG